MYPGSGLGVECTARQPGLLAAVVRADVDIVGRDDYARADLRLDRGIHVVVGPRSTDADQPGAEAIALGVVDRQVIGRNGERVDREVSARAAGIVLDFRIGIS